MTETEIKEMLNGIINNGEKWECRCSKQECCSDCNYSCIENKIWQPYKLGEGIHDDWEYRKVVKKTWLEEYLDVNCDSKIEAHNSKIDIENVCKKILEEVKCKIAEKQTLGFTFSDIDSEELKEIIKELGIEV